MVDMGINLFKRTANLSESEPRMTSAWDGFKGGQLFDVPLHDKDREYRTVSTGLVRVRPAGIFGKGLTDWVGTTMCGSRSPPVPLPSRVRRHHQWVPFVAGRAPHLLPRARRLFSRNPNG